MRYFATLIVAAMLINGALAIKAHCDRPDQEREKCGWLGITKGACISKGCCFDPKPRGYVPRCYHGRTVDSYLSGSQIGGHKPVTGSYVPATVATDTSYLPKERNPHRLSLLALVQMKRDNVSQSIINSLLADTIPGGEIFYALQDGKLDHHELLELMKGHPSLEWNEWMKYYLSGKDINDILYSRLAESYGIDSTVVKLLMTNNQDPVIKHYVAVLSSKGQLNPLSKFIFASITSEQGLTKQGMTDFVVEQIFQHENRFTVEAYKALLAGDKAKAIQWAFISSRQRVVPLKKYYPKNEALFAYFVDNQLNHPGKITPSMILSLALNNSIKALNPDKSFTELFGIKAFDYVCAAHTEDLRLSCKAVEHKPYPSSLDCILAGCCLRESDIPGRRPVCYENVIGHIGVGIAEKFWDEDFIIANLFDGEIPSLEQFFPDGIPWIPSNELPSQYTSYLRRDPNQPDWFTSLTSGGFNLYPNPTLMPNTRPSKFRPGFVWKPHGATPFPYPTELPGGGNHVPTDEPGIVGGEHVEGDADPPIVQALSTRVFASCRGVKPEDRYECMPNHEALSAGGEFHCRSLDCCYDPVYKDISGVAVCFRKATYGQCYLVPPEERLDCGEPGISKDKCLENPRCCYDSTIDPEKHKDPVPWCYFKKQSFVTDQERCTRVGNDDRVGCFPHALGAYYNNAVSKEVCEQEGCCYEKVHVSYFDRTLFGKAQPPTCYKKKEIIIAPVDPKPTDPPAPSVDPPPAPVCKSREELDPYDREDCGNYNYFLCVHWHECCYYPEFVLPGAPWCFKRT